MRVPCLFAVVYFAVSTAQASMGPIPGEEKFTNMASDQPNTMGAEAGFTRIDEDYFVRLVIKSELNLGKIGFGFQIPLQLRAWDRDPKNNNDYYKIIRREDWDEPQKFLRVIRYVRLGHKRDPFYLRVGELAAQIGHGTIMSRYLNNLDVNNFRVGSEFDINTDYGGVETVISDFGSLAVSTAGKGGPESRVVGLRGHVKPYSFVDKESPLNMFAVGVSVVSDTNAPNTLEIGADGRPLVDGSNPKVADTQATTVYGFDVEAELMHNDLLDIIPYSDLNFIAGAGWGWHLGTLITAKMPIGFELSIPLRLEYRRFSSNYAPIYFSTFYEVERFGFPLSGATGVPTPKGRYFRSLAGGEGLNGYYADLAFNFAGILQIGAVYEAYDQGDPNVAAFLAVPALEVIKFKAYYARTGVQGTKDIFALDDRSMAVAEGRYELIPFTYAVVRWSRSWILDTDANSAHFGTYQSTDNWKVGLEANFTF